MSWVEGRKFIQFCQMSALEGHPLWQQLGPATLGAASASPLSDSSGALLCAGGHQGALHPLLALVEQAAQQPVQTQGQHLVEGERSWHMSSPAYLSSVRPCSPALSNHPKTRSQLKEEQSRKEQLRSLFWGKPYSKGFATVFREWPKSHTHCKCASQRCRIF